MNLKRCLSSGLRTADAVGILVVIVTTASELPLPFARTEFPRTMSAVVAFCLASVGVIHVEQLRSSQHPTSGVTALWIPGQGTSVIIHARILYLPPFR